MGSGLSAQLSQTIPGPLLDAPISLPTSDHEGVTSGNLPQYVQAETSGRARSSRVLVRERKDLTRDVTRQRAQRVVFASIRLLFEALCCNMWSVKS